jgi:hypothetical protein
MGRRRLVRLLLAFVVAVVLGSVVVAAPAGAEPPPVLCIPGPGTPCPAPPTQPGGLDHFLCYQATDTPTQFPAPKLTLTDQFGTKSLTQPQADFPAGNDRLCNPTTKLLPSGVTYPAGNPNAHLFCLHAVKPTPNALVTVSNQFGTGDLTVGASTRLCVPSWKYDVVNPAAAGSVAPTAWNAAAPPGLDHYQCYAVTYSDAASGRFGHPTVDLADQFGPHTAVTVGDPVELCAPVTKTLLTGDVFPANNIDGGPATALDSEHLLCYSVTVDGQRAIQIGNQFSPGWNSASAPIPQPESITTGIADELCLPSFKTLVPPPDTPEAPNVLVLPISALTISGAWVARRRRRRQPAILT